MKKFRHLALVLLLFNASSCAMIFNEKTVDVSINSNPSGADIFINGMNYGKTPATVQIEPKNQIVTLTKEGHGSAQLNLESWVIIRNGYCMADVIGTMLLVPYYSFYWSGYCNDFKQKEHFVSIPRLGPSVGSAGDGSLIGIGNSPNNMIDYYYNRDMMKNDMMRNPYENPYAVHQQGAQ